MGYENCKFCDYKGRKDNLKRHIYRMHQNNKPSVDKTSERNVLYCYCGKTFGKKCSLKRHLDNSCNKRIGDSSDDRGEAGNTLVQSSG